MSWADKVKATALTALAGRTTTAGRLEVQSAEAYTITVDSIVDGDKTHAVLRARRNGDCAK
jgi:hypothetical protein